MIGKSIAAGLAGIRRRFGLVVLLYGVNLALAFVLSVPVYFALQSSVGPTGFGADLAGGFDFVLWADVMEKAGAVLRALPLQLLWMIPLYLLWKTAASVGLIHALRGEQIRPFWQGVGRYTGKALLLALLFLVPLVVWIVLTLVAALMLGAILEGEVGGFWLNLVIVPTLLVGGLAVLDLMHDYARIALVVAEQRVGKAAATGIAWPFRHGQASWLYLAWFVPALLLLLLPALLDANAVAATAGAVWGLFLLQQFVLLLRAAVTVGWIGSETAFYEMIWIREAPLIAEQEAEAPLAAEAMPGSQQGGLASA